MDKYPTRVGFEGSGKVVASGGGFMANRLVGKNVCFASSEPGTWSEYHIASASTTFTLSNSEDIDTAACSIANPMTALAFLDILQAK